MPSLTPLGRKIIIRSAIILSAILFLMVAGVAGVVYFYGPKLDSNGSKRAASRSYSLDLSTGPLPLEGANSSNSGDKPRQMEAPDFPNSKADGQEMTDYNRPRAERDSDAILKAPLNTMPLKNKNGRAVPSYLTDRSPLPPAPDNGVTKMSELGPLPVIGEDGRKPWMVYAKPFSQPNRPSTGADDKLSKPPALIGVVVGFLGSSSEISESAIAQLPGNVTLAIDPYNDRVEWWLAKARANGHETLLGLPLEPQDYPKSDAGAAALLTSLSEADNRLRLEWLLSRGTGFVGVVNMSGEKFISQPRVTIPLLKNLNGRGLILVANGYDQSSTADSDGIATPAKIRRVGRLARDIGVPRAMVDIRLSGGMTATTVRQRLMAAEQIAQMAGQTVVMVERPTLEILNIVTEWLIGFDESAIRVAPVSAIVDRQADKPVVTLDSIKKASNVR